MRPHSLSCRAWVSASELVVALCHQNLAGQPLVAQRPVSGGHLLIRLRRIVVGALPQQPQPIPGRDQRGHTGVSQPIHREPSVRIGRMRQLRRSEQKRPIHPRGCQVDRHIARRRWR